MFQIIEKRSDNTTIAILCDEPMTFLQDGSSNSELKNHPIKINHETKIKPPNQTQQNTMNPRRHIRNQNLAQSAKNQNENQTRTNKPTGNQNKTQQATYIMTKNTPQQTAYIKTQNISQQNTSSKLPYLPGHNPTTNPNLIINILSNQKCINWPEKELPNNYVPSYYDLNLHFPKNNRNPINGIVNILFKVKSMGDHLFLNIDTNIKINSIKQNGNELKYVAKYPFLLIYKAEYPYIIQSEYPIVINYTLQCENIFNFTWQKKGFLFCNGLYITRCGLNNSKKLLPCYDDYHIDVSLKLKLTIPSKLKGFSNLPVFQIRKIQNEKEIEFSKVFSKPVVFTIFVGKFEKIVEIKTKRGLPIKAFTNHYINEPTCTNMIKTAAFAIEWIESKIGVKYEFPDFNILFCSDISNYASSSPGLIFCTDRGRMGSKGNFIIAHEIVHQWFGQYTRIKNPNSLWLNEGFANFIAYLIMKDPERIHIYDKSRNIFTWEDFLHNELINSLRYFKKGIVFPDENIDFEQYDDMVVYSKGSFIVKMFYDIVGERDFFGVCEKYLKKYKNKKVDIPDFLQITNKLLFAKNMYNFFDPWLKNVGFPVLFVEEIISDKKKVGLKITQKNDICYQFQVPIMYEKNNITKTMNVMIKSLINRVYIEFDRIIVNHNIESLCFVVYSSQSLCIKEKLSEYDIIFYKYYSNEFCWFSSP